LTGSKKYDKASQANWQIGVLIEHWIEAVEEFFKRLDQDWTELLSVFKLTETTITALQMGVSDSHNRGRSVVIMTFANDQRLVYKPRSIEAEAQFTRLLKQLETIGLPHLSKPLITLVCDGYGWVNYIDRQDCTTQEEVAHYFERLGGLLALLYSLGTSDIHHENLIAQGAYPVLVDLETFLHPIPKTVGSQYDESWERFNSVQRVGLLPNNYVSHNETFVDISVLGSQVLTVESRFGAWRNINCDNMHLGDATSVEIKRYSLPSLNGQICSTQAYTTELIAGFRTTYNALLAAVPLILSQPDLLAPQDCPIRFVLRDTAVYTDLLDYSLHPQLMTSGIDRSIELERLYRSLVDDRRSDLQSVVQTEKNSLEHFDIPYFWCTADGTDLKAGDTIVAANFFAKSGLQVTRDLIARLSQADLEHQVAILGASLEFFYTLG
jgi:type 2 lantibiotic biosynthesis protein LanM